MAINTSYGAGNTSTVTQSPALQVGANDLDFWREMARRSMANRQPQQQMEQPMTMMRSSGGRGSAPRPTTRENVKRFATGGGGEAGEHSFVTNMKGGAQVMGGYVPSSFGASPGNTFYSGWNPGSRQGAVRFENLPDNSGTPAIAPSMDPALRARMLNAGLPSANFMPMGG